MASSSNSPCAACKFLRRKCTQGCVFAPYFPPDQPSKFANVHRVFGASNVAKLLNDLAPAQREDAVNSLAYEAEARLKDPVYGCVGHISILQHQLNQIQHDLMTAKKELSTYIGPAAHATLLPHHPFLAQNPHLQAAAAASMPPFGVAGMGMGLGLHPAGPAPPQAAMQHPQLAFFEHQQQLEAQQLAAAVREQERLHHQQQHHHLHQHQHQQQQEFARLNSGFDGVVLGFNNQMAQGGPSIAIASPQPTGQAMVSTQPFDELFQLQQQQQPPSQQQQQQQHRDGRDEGRSGC